MFRKCSTPSRDTREGVYALQTVAKGLISLAHRVAHFTAMSLISRALRQIGKLTFYL